MSEGAHESLPAERCECGTELAPNFLACPVCHRLVHAERLAALVAESRRLEAGGDLRGALGCLRSALGLLPPGTKQHAVLGERASRLSDAVDRGESGAAIPSPLTGSRSSASSNAAPDLPVSPAFPDARGSNPLLKAGAAAGGLAFLAWKFKFVLVFLATKAKLLLLGLGKASTLLSMLASLGLYWALWGWKFALGVVLSIYVHEMGHVAALRHFGIPAKAPMFVPGLGAFVRLESYPQTAREDARIGLAGPIYGLGCACAVALAYAATGIPMLGAIASVAAWINLFNLIPVWQLDGSRGFRTLSMPTRLGLLVLIAGCGYLFEEGLYVAIGAGATFRLFTHDAPPETDRRSLIEFATLLIGLGLIASLEIPIPRAD